MPDSAGVVEPFWSLCVYFVAVLALVIGMVVISFVLGERRFHRLADTPYESGVKVTGSARVRFSVNYYLVALFFVIFDLESIFLFAWAISVREVGMVGYCTALFFVVMLLVTLVYLWRVGALDYGGRRISK